MANSGTSDTPKLGGWRAWGAWLIGVTFVVYYFSFQTGYSIVNSRVQEDVGLTIAQVGFIAALYTWVFAICQFLAGPLLDRLGARKVLLPAIVLVTIGVFLFAGAQNFSMLLLSQVFIALGACTGFVGAGYIGGTWFGWAKFSLMFGFVQFFASLFSAFNQNLLSRALETWPWRELFTSVAGFGVMLFIIALFRLRDPTPVEVVGERGIRPFLHSVASAMAKVGAVPMVWIAAAFGALCFGVMLALGVVWGPKLMMVRGLDPATANFTASLLWLGLAAGCFVTPWISDRLRRRKLPTTVGIAIQLVALTLILFAPPMGAVVDMFLCFAFGFGNSAHMLAFSAASDVVEPENIGTSAAIVNGIMFIVGGIMISRPGMRIGLGQGEGLEPASAELAQFASRPLLLAILIAFLIAIFMRETYPGSRKTSGTD
ncbi:MFS transporter [Microbulbifer harenosus]|uniref:MFS transporter n=1 Tax=Microbulbifer harenosus TaxID=2576840 RepID=A0ABY2UID6_9GAMM|nr:MFS transporter [Microbulbifer harenosus]TLM77348.1 MFS transporter [Microbulbifer harenosus]